MSEQLNNSHEEEKKPVPMFDQCSNCDEKYELTKDNTAAMEYIKQPECNWLFCVCPTCSFQTKIFIGDGNTLANCYLAGIEVVRDQYADDNVYSDWLEVKGIELPKTHELTHRHEELMGRFATALTTTPDEHLYDLITDTGYEQPYPQRWI